MKIELQKKLDASRDRLVRELNVGIGFLSTLVSKSIITSEHKAEISTMPTDHGKVDKLLDILKRCSEECFYGFRDCLQIVNADLYRLLCEDSTTVNMPAHYPPVNPSASGNTTSGRKYFYIKTALEGSDMVLGTEDNECRPGAKVVLSRPTRGTIWYQDDDDIIRSRDNDLVLDGEGHEFHLNRYNRHNQRGFWRINGNYIVNKYDHNEVVELKQADNAVGTEIFRNPRNDEQTQQWHFGYI